MADWLIMALPLVLALGLSAALTPVVKAVVVRLGLLDQPGERRSHSMPTARGGGVALVLAVVVTAFALAGMAVAAPVVGLLVALAAIGWLDDVSDLPVRWRLPGFFAVAALMLWITGPVGAVAVGPLVLDWPWLWSALALIAVVWLINLHNFMDGADGLAAMQLAWSGVLFGLLLFDPQAPVTSTLAFSLAGAALGFLVWNRPQASIFMGDVGSVSAGGLVGFLALSGAASGQVSIWVSLMICSVFVVDATATLIRRARSGQRWYTAHREHAYQRLLVLGWSHGRVLGLYGLVNVAVVLPFVLAALSFPAWDFPLALCLIALLFGAWYVVQCRASKEHYA